ncbi:MAG: hypothetical protein ACRDJM_03190, partial [Actinomycetota bacterium]
MRDRDSSRRCGAARCALAALAVLSGLPGAAGAQPQPFMRGTAAILARDTKPFPANALPGPLPLGEQGARSGATEHNPPTLSPGFDAVADQGTIAPPDASGAVGPAHVLTVTAQDVVVHSRAGAQLSSSGLQAWWAGLGATNVFDPHAFYDPYGGRFVFVAASDPGAEASSLLLAVTQTGDPTGSWFRYRIDDKGGATYWVDAPVAGFNNQWLTIQAGMMR